VPLPAGRPPHPGVPKPDGRPGQVEGVHRVIDREGGPAAVLPAAGARAGDTGLEEAPADLARADQAEKNGPLLLGPRRCADTSSDPGRSAGARQGNPEQHLKKGFPTPAADTK
jgi:hypothetical protein